MSSDVCCNDDGAGRSNLMSHHAASISSLKKSRTPKPCPWVNELVERDQRDNQRMIHGHVVLCLVDAKQTTSTAPISSRSGRLSQLSRCNTPALLTWLLRTQDRTAGC